MNYVDFRPDDEKKTDPECLERTYDSHKGTDFALPDAKAMEEGVDVLAAADGIVQKIRDGEPDLWADEAKLKEIQDARKECGNAVLIDHGSARQTIYCHLKKNSIVVKKGQEVTRGEKIAQVGLSGFTQFPHLHFGVIWENAIIDPFTGQTNTDSCGKVKRRFWAEDVELTYQPFVIQDIGFQNTVPKLDKIEHDSSTPDNINTGSDILAFWVTILGAREGDEITIEIRDPNNKIFAKRSITQDKTRARQFYYTGRKIRSNPLVEGAYTGSIKISRPAQTKNSAPLEKTKTTAILVKP
ncbi:MAG: M23 family metallopeptidase [Alphaproteobacteria bacterium]|nr:M23 family metallopeptidase [Alphaproteobacteria bacterium]